jgi:hypothetical protein
MLRDSWHGMNMHRMRALGIHAGIFNSNEAGNKLYTALNRLFKRLARL